MASIQDFVISKVRVKLLEAFLLDPEEMFYIRELTRKISEEINAVRRELIHMQSVGMVKDEKRGNRIYYTFNKNYLFHKELMSMVGKMTGLGEAMLSREINYTVMTEAELTYRKTHSDPFIARILSASRVMILGDEEELVQ